MADAPNPYADPNYDGSVKAPDPAAPGNPYSDPNYSGDTPAAPAANLALKASAPIPMGMSAVVPRGGQADLSGGEGAFARSAAQSVIPSASAALGSRIGTWVGGGLGALVPIGGETGGTEVGGAAVGKVAGGFLGGLVGMILGDKGQRAALGAVDPHALEELERYNQSDQSHPLASFAGGVAGGSAVFKLAPLTAARGAAALIKGSRLGMGALTQTERQAAAVFATQAGMGAAAGVVSPLLSGQAPTLKGVGEATAQGLMFGEDRFGSHPPEAEPTAPPQTKAQETLAKGTAKVKDILAPQPPAVAPPAPPPIQGDYRYTVQRDQPDGQGGTIPGYVQIDGPGADGKNESSNLDELRARGINLPDVPDHLPQGQYTLDQIKASTPQPITPEHQEIRNEFGPNAPAPGEPWIPTKIKQAPQPDQFNSVQEVLDFRAKRMAEERALYQEQIGLSDAQAARLQDLMRRDAPTKLFEKTLTPEQKARLNHFFDYSPYNRRDGPFQSWETDPRAKPEEIAGETDPEELSKHLINAAVRGIPDTLGDRFLTPFMAGKRMEELGLTKSDIARALDSYTTRNSGSQGDKAEAFADWGGKINGFLESQGIHLKDGDLAKTLPEATPRLYGPRETASAATPPPAPVVPEQPPPEPGAPAEPPVSPTASPAANAPAAPATPPASPENIGPLDRDPAHEENVATVAPAGHVQDVLASPEVKAALTRAGVTQDYLHDELGVSDPRPALAKAEQNTGAGLDPTVRPATFDQRGDQDSAARRAHTSLRTAWNEVAKRVTHAAGEVVKATADHASRAEKLQELQDQYLSAEPVARAIQEDLLARTKRVVNSTATTAEAMGQTKAMLEALDGKLDAKSLGEYRKTFAGLLKNFGGKGGEAHLFDLMDELTHVLGGQRLSDLTITGVRNALIENGAREGGSGLSSDLTRMAGNTKEAKATLALLLTFAKEHPEVMAPLERRREPIAAKRLALAVQLDNLKGEKAAINQSIRGLSKASTLAERARFAKAIAIREQAAAARTIARLNKRIEVGNAIAPHLHAAEIALAREQGYRPAMVAANGWGYKVPEKADATREDLAKTPEHTLSLNSGEQATAPSVIHDHLEKLAAFLRYRKAAAEADPTSPDHPLDADYMNAESTFNALAKVKGLDAAAEKVHGLTWAMNWTGQGRQLMKVGTPLARKLATLLGKYEAVNAAIRAPFVNDGKANTVKVYRAMRELNRGVNPEAQLSEAGFKAKFKDRAKMELERSGSLRADSPAERDARVWQRLRNEWSTNEETARYFTKEKADAFIARMKDLMADDERQSKRNVNHAVEHGLQVKDDRIFVRKSESDPTLVPAERPASPAGPHTFSRGFSDRGGEDFRQATSLGWEALKDKAGLIADTFKAKGADGVRALLGPHFTDAKGKPVGMLDAFGTEATNRLLPKAPGGDGYMADAAPGMVNDAWAKSNGDLVEFARLLHESYGGKPEQQGQHLQEVVDRMSKYYQSLKENMNPEQSALTSSGFKGIKAPLTTEARIIENSPSVHHSYIDFDAANNQSYAQRLAWQAVMGRNGEHAEAMWTAAKSELDSLLAPYDKAMREAAEKNKSGPAVEAAAQKALGKAEYDKLKALDARRAVLGKTPDAISRYFSVGRGGAGRLMSESLRTMVFNMVQKPTTAELSMGDAIAPFLNSGASLSNAAQSSKIAGRAAQILFGSLAEAIHPALGDKVATDPIRQYEFGDRGATMSLHDQLASIVAEYKHGMEVAAQKGNAKWERPAQAMRAYRAGMSLSPREGRNFPAFTPLAAKTLVMKALHMAGTIQSIARLEGMVAKVAAHLDTDPRAADPLYSPTGADLGMKGYGEAETFDKDARQFHNDFGLTMRQLADQARAARAANPNAPLLSPFTRALAHGSVETHVTNVKNLMNVPADPGTVGKLLYGPLLSWAAIRAQEVAAVPQDAKNQITPKSFARALPTLAAVAAGSALTVWLRDQYKEKLLGRKSASAGPVQVGQEAMGGDYTKSLMDMADVTAQSGAFGLFGEGLSGLVNKGGTDTKQMDLDSRIVAASALETFKRLFTSYVNERAGKGLTDSAALPGKDYVGLQRPFMQMATPNFLEGWQAVNHGFGLNNEEAQTTARMSATAWLRSTAEKQHLEGTRGFGAGPILPTPLTPYISRMVLATYGGDQAAFAKAWQEAKTAARTQQVAAQAAARASGAAIPPFKDPDAEVLRSFEARHPLSAVFARKPTAMEHAQLLGAMPPEGRAAVQQAERNFDHFLSAIGGQPYQFR